MFSRPRAFALSTTVLLGSTLASGDTAATTVKALTAAPLQYVNRPITVTGQFIGRTRTGATRALAPLNRSRWDFLLAVEDSAVWVSGIRPAGWDFDLDPRSSADAGRGRWLQVTGTLRMTPAAASCREATRCSQLWIEASDLKSASPEPGLVPSVRPVQAPVVVFHDPIDGESGVGRDASVRFQFSRALAAETLSERIRVSYASPRPLTAAPIPKFTARYDEALRAVTITFTERLAAWQEVEVELLEGIAATNGLRLAPGVYRFTTGN